MMRHNRKYIIAAISLFLCLTATVGLTVAYFTDYEDARGGAIVRLSGQTEITEEMVGNDKVIKIKNTGETDMIVRVFVFGDENALTVPADGTGSGWAEADGAFYYTSILKPGEETTPLKASVNANATDNIDFNIIVAHESSRVIYEVKDNQNIVKAPDGWDETIVNAIPAV